MIVGCDPGVSGALAFLRGDGKLLAVRDMPTFSVRVGRTQRQRVDAAGLATLLREFHCDHAAVERVSPRATDTPITAGYLLHAAGVVEGVLAAVGIPVTMVDPSAWRRAVGASGSPGMAYRDRKEVSRRRAIQLYPEQAAWFARVLDADRAEAALIGRWGLTAAGVLAGAA